MAEIVLGIDPGLTGGIAALDWRGQVLALEDMPTRRRIEKTAVVRDEVDVEKLARLLVSWSHLQEWAAHSVVAYVERIQARPGIPGGKGKPFRKFGAGTGFVLGDGFGSVRGVLAGRFVRVEWVRPQDWKRAYGFTKPDKEVARLAALNFYPNAPITRKKDHGKAEALLIARYGVHMGEPVTLPSFPAHPPV